MLKRTLPLIAVMLLAACAPHGHGKGGMSHHGKHGCCKKHCCKHEHAEKAPPICMKHSGKHH